MAKGSQVEGPNAPMMHLDHEGMTALGLHTGKLPTVGSKMDLSGMAHVHAVGESEQGRHMTIALHDMKVGTGKQQLLPEGDSTQMQEGMKAAVDKAVKAPKENGSEKAKKKSKL